METVADVAKGIIPRFTGPGTVISRRSEVMADSGITAETVVPQSFTANAIVSLQEPSSLKQSIRPLAPVGASFLVNRFKLYNAPTTFKIIPPLPTGLANVTFSPSDRLSLSLYTQVHTRTHTYIYKLFTYHTK